MNLQGLAEAIILQAIEDLLDEEYRDESVRFFEDDWISICTKLAGMDLHDEVRLFNLVNTLMNPNAGKPTLPKIYYSPVVSEKTK